MPERRLQFTTRDESGRECRGDILITATWHSGIIPDPHAAFTIILTQQPAEGTPDAVPEGIAVCVPASPIKLPASVREPQAPYGTADAEAAEMRLPRSIVASYSKGTIWAADELSVTATDVFLTGAMAPRFDALARALINTSQQAERFWRTLAEALSRPQPGSPRVDPIAIREQLRDLVENSHGTSSLEAAARLRRIAESGSPQQLGTDATALADDIARLRALGELPAESERLAAMRAYLAGARLVEDSDMARDYPYTKEQLSFVALLDQPHLIDGMRATFETFRSRYTNEYVRHHDQFWQAMASLQQTLLAAEPTARAVVHLNSLKRLGRPLGLESLRDFQRLKERPRTCSQPDVLASIREQPLCPTCSVSLSDDAPEETTANTIQDLEQALSNQQTRLASEAVHRILARGGERLEQFLQIVQASDLSGLVAVLDDDLVSFLDDLLAEPTATAAE